ncbi:MAG TPA: family 20 glycosylhydrolase [Bryobacteraceae bacterium]|nr:family 20 glycosylhydrolase [Bryobacteraceae bacterium]
MKTIWITLLGAATLVAQPNLMPWPARITMGEGNLAIDGTFGVAIAGNPDARMRKGAARFLETLSRQTGLPFAETGAKLQIECDSPGAAIQQLGEDESYRLEVTPQQAVLHAPNPLGILRGLATFLQLVEPGTSGFVAPAVVIEDKPRFPWRGLHLDVSRHWMPLEVVKRNLDGMAAVKLNVFHWHLSDDQGFRIESKRFPKLHELGSDGHYYTQDQVRDVIAYARDRGIRVVPEFDMPGHATSWFVGYAQLASGPGPYQIERKFGIFDPAMDPSREATYEFLDQFIGEMTTLFPDAYFHIGGDEVNGEQWKKTEHIQAFMNDHRIADNRALQAYFTKQVQRLVAKHGKHTQGWDEVLSADMPKDVLVQSWQSQKPLAEAARQGYSGILSAGYYLDHMEPASTVYLVDPIANETANLTPEEKARILGGEVCMWSEYVSAENVDSRIWPRTAVIAERFWSPQEIRDVASMYKRVDAISPKLEFVGLTHLSSYLPMLRRLAGGLNIDALKILADVVQPANQDARDEANNTQWTPLNRLVDAARSKSKTARDFRTLVENQDLPRIRAWLILWRDNDAKLEPLLGKSFLLKEAIPVSKMLKQLAEIGLDALDGKVSDQSAFLAEAKKLHAEVEIAIVPSIEKLVAAAK